MTSKRFLMRVSISFVARERFQLNTACRGVELGSATRQFQRERVVGILSLRTS
jgi:hypothetical protein